ncbi:glycosyltransferase family 61 protein [Spirosoma sp. BT702]|uniref:Glycosyltransferase family 61 protein n=1 Tax=Spirosoma profusum TaxID=2771354 RepID=A0A926Y397_9BACT|nr:glycosyltransferase family 61 protein [Spirosoma profusum]MBD2701660.1 glycosyltransferase family 61 protein [Spirosoma profusum]
MSLRKIFYRLLRVFGVTLLNKPQTDAFLEPYLIRLSPPIDVFLPNVFNQSVTPTRMFQRQNATTFPAYVWRCTGPSQTIRQLAYGGVLFDRHLLCVDFDNYHLVKNFLTPPKRDQVQRTSVIVPFTHHLDGVILGGYYDFVILVAAKLCRIKEAMGADFAEAVVSYPHFKTAYERDFLELIGFTPDRIFDSRRTEIQFEQCLMGNSGHWFYPHPDDIMALKKQVEGKLNITQTQRNRIYVSRSGRRRIANEDALIKLLKKYDFQIIDDRPRTVAEQVSIYKNASYIIGPHGASFTNIIWCEPGTHLFELFSSKYIVDHFFYLSQLMGINYTAYHHVIQFGQVHHDVEEDIFVSIADIEKILEQTFLPLPSFD